MTPPARQPSAVLRRSATLLLVLLTGLAATAAAGAYVADVAQRQQAERFNLLADEAVEKVRVRMEAYVATLRATRGLFVDGREPSRRSFAEFTAALELSRHYPGIQGIGWAKLLRPAEVAAHEAAVRAEGLAGFRVWPAGERAPYSAITYLEPFDWRNQRALGFDMLQEPARGEAMRRARDRAEAAATGRVELVQESGAERQPGFLVYVPVYAGAPATAAEREAALTGWVYAPFRAGDLLGATLDRAAAAAVDLEVYDGTAAAPAALLFDGDARRSSLGAPRARSTQVEIAGRPWTLVASPGAGHAQRWERWLPRAVVAAGLALTGLLWWTTRAESLARERAEDAARRAAFLAAAGRTLASSLEYAATLQLVAEAAAAAVCDGCAVLVQEPSEDEPLRLAATRPGTTGVLDGLDPAGAPAGGPALRDLPGPAGPRHVLSVPLFARGEPLGAILLVAAGDSSRFGPADLAMAEDLARLAVAAVDTARLYRRAQHSLRLRDDFLSIASHELKTPLTSLGLQSESLRAQAGRASPEAVARKAEAIRRNVERLGRLVTALLDLSRIRSGRLDLEIEEVDLADVAREVVGRFDEEARRAGSELRLVARAPVAGRWDRLRLDQVLTNLVSNALKYGAGQPVEVVVEARGPWAVLEVRDRGIGIDPGDQGRIFERFERAVSDRNYGGFGLGLWIVRRIVEALGGHVSVESARGRGAAFRVELEREPAGASRAPPVPASERGHPCDGSRPG
jgi:signal transduction histidine kinase